MAEMPADAGDNKWGERMISERLKRLGKKEKFLNVKFELNYC